MSPERTLKIGLLSFAHVHAAGFATLLQGWEGVELLCADPDGKGGPEGEVRGPDLAEKLGVNYVETYEELFSWGPDAVVVCSENARHRTLVERAAQHGCDVLCEKPLATTVADGEAMVDACRRAEVFLMVAYPVRFAPEFEVMQEAVRRGALGDLLMALGTNNGQIPVGDRAWFTNPELSGGGALVDHVVHVADLLDALLGGAEAETVRAVTNQILHADKPQVQAETGGLVTVNYPSGFSATIDCSWSQPDDAPTWGGLTLRLFGSQGTSFIAPFGQRVNGFTQTGAFPHALHLSYGEDLNRRLLEAFLEGVRSGEAPQPDGEVGLRTLRIVAAAQESAATGVPVPLR